MGADLNNIVKTQRLSDDHVQFLVYQILRGLKYVHSAGIIHRVGSILYILSSISFIILNLKFNRMFLGPWATSLSSKSVLNCLSYPA